MALTTHIRQFVNRGLSVLGLELTTTRRQRLEKTRLQALRERGHWSRPRFTGGLCLQPQLSLRFLGEICIPYRDRYTSWPKKSQHADGAQAFFLQNGWFQSVDAEVLYCLLRARRSATVVEVGSGFSTRLMRLAIGDGNLSTRLISIDPCPRTQISDFADDHWSTAVEELNAEDLAGRLCPNDILFIDSSHTVTTGGDVSFLFLEVIPRLRPGVLVHVHDIFLPFDYPMEWVIDYQWGWNEQYLVHALLCENDCLEILWPAYYMWRFHQDEVRAVIPAEPDSLPSSLWLAKR